MMLLYLSLAVVLDYYISEVLEIFTLLRLFNADMRCSCCSQLA
jgi:hypothetical protein